MYNFFDLLYPFSSDNSVCNSKALDQFSRNMCKNIIRCLNIVWSSNVNKHNQSEKLWSEILSFQRKRTN